jgi:hypothetical protein
VSSISSESETDQDSDTDPGFDDKKKNTDEKLFLCFFDQKMEFTYPKASIKDIVQASGKAFSPQNSTSSTSKDEIY